MVLFNRKSKQMKLDDLQQIKSEVKRFSDTIDEAILLAIVNFYLNII